MKQTKATKQVMERLLLKTDAAAEILGCSISSLNKSRNTGILLGVKALPHVSIGGRNVFYRPEDLRAWVDQFQSQTIHEKDASMTAMLSKSNRKLFSRGRVK